MTAPDPNAWQQAWAPYARCIPGFAYLQGLPPAPVAPPAQGAAAAWTQWVAPVFDVDELDRRIRDLQAVHFWLEQNARALQATIQALQVQRMTLAALRSMNVSLSSIGPAATPAPAASDAPSEASAASAGAEAAAPADGGTVDPVRWWRAVTEQFQAIAAQTMQDLARPGPAAPPAQAAAPTPSPPAGAQRARTAPEAPPAAARRARR